MNECIVLSDCGDVSWGKDMHWLVWVARDFNALLRGVSNLAG